ncbi:hypothetical protein LPU83_pLPU83c_0805 (plasmid) [Rhizobium favelukesii]|uniref:DUF4142 domain-containing protein n=1 Tax=Rhizobium favelukesii TaxID=348824 RepID=W6RJP5_9HYPH|nr:hypothetical protein LPU83_pLPU83c_0805 [Rhizobium favelukesii]
MDLSKRHGDERGNAVLKAWAAKMWPALEYHLEMAKELNKGSEPSIGPEAVIR